MRTEIKELSIIIPVHNEELSLEPHHKKIVKKLNSLDISYEILYIDDGSTDNSLKIIKALCGDYDHTRYISFSRNFGKEAATSAGLNECLGCAAIMIDADGQHPISLIDTFIEQWKKGYDVVVGVRISNRGEGVIKKYGSKIFYKTLNYLSSDNTQPGSTDFRLIDRKVIDEFNKLTERGRITRGLIDWLGFKRKYVEFSANERAEGSASYGFSKLLSLALNAFISHSTMPLKAVGSLGIFITILAGIVGLFIIIEMYILGDPMSLAITGTASLAIFLSFLIGVVLACQGLLALYIESIFKESQNRPLYIISEKSQT